MKKLNEFETKLGIKENILVKKFHFISVFHLRIIK